MKTMRLKLEIISPDSRPREKSLGLQLWPRDLNLSDEIWHKACVAKPGLMGDGIMQSLSIWGETVHMQSVLAGMVGRRK